jgi:hypothetical protein
LGETASHALRAKERSRSGIKVLSAGFTILTGLIQADEAGQRLNDDELVSMVMLLILAGYETTAHLIANSVVSLLLHHPQQDSHVDGDAQLLAQCLLALRPHVARPLPQPVRRPPAASHPGSTGAQPRGALHRSCGRPRRPCAHIGGVALALIQHTCQAAIKGVESHRRVFSELACLGRDGREGHRDRPERAFSQAGLAHHALLVCGSEKAGQWTESAGRDQLEVSQGDLVENKERGSAPGRSGRLDGA